MQLVADLEFAKEQSSDTCHRCGAVKGDGTRAVLKKVDGDVGNAGLVRVLSAVDICVKEDRVADRAQGAETKISGGYGRGC